MVVSVCFSPHQSQVYRAIKNKQTNKKTFYNWVFFSMIGHSEYLEFKLSYGLNTRNCL